MPMSNEVLILWFQLLESIHILQNSPSLYFITFKWFSESFVSGQTYTCTAFGVGCMLGSRMSNRHIHSLQYKYRVFYKKNKIEEVTLFCCFRDQRSWEEKISSWCTTWRWRFNLRRRTLLVLENSTWKSTCTQWAHTSQTACRQHHLQ